MCRWAYLPKQLLHLGAVRVCVFFLALGMLALTCPNARPTTRNILLPYHQGYKVRFPPAATTSHVETNAVGAKTATETSDGLAEESHYFEEADIAVVVGAVQKYVAFAKSTLQEDEMAVQEGRPLQVFLLLSYSIDA